MTKAKTAGTAALLVSAFFWATAYIFVKQLIADIPPCFLLAVRYAIAAAIMLAAYLPKRRLLTWKMVLSGTIMGIFLFGEFFTFTVGLQYTTTSRSSLLIASYIILLPLAYWLIRRRRPARIDVLTAVVCMVGVCFIVGGNLGGFQIGDIYCLACAMCYAIYIVVSAKYSREYDTGLLNAIQITVTAVLSIFCSLIVGDYHGGITLPAFGGLVYLAVVCTILPFFLCLFGMKRVSTTASGILLSFESVFAAVMGVLLLHELFYWQLGVGAGIVVFSFFLPAVIRKAKPRP
ncbi:MAG TPA: EamA/RhaT family transporter [Lachnospiraceae bacterium]|jgi:drug/metabolite transporter (DMT)-like permease|nr:EamA/RhaT family transporter [Lachnospiraceae bacterium]